MPLPVNASVRSPDGTFCSVKWPEPSTSALGELPTIETVRAPPAGGTEAPVAVETTVPEIMVPVTGPIGPAGEDDAAVGDWTPLLPQAVTRTAATITAAPRRTKTLRIE